MTDTIPTLDTDEILVALAGAVATVTLNRPTKLNSVTAEMAHALVEVSAWANTSDAVRAVVLTGAGDRAFCAGSDIRQLDTYATPWEFRNREDYCDALRRPRDGDDLRHPDRSGDRVIRGAGGQARLDRRRRHEHVPGPLCRLE